MYIVKVTLKDSSSPVHTHSVEQSYNVHIHHGFVHVEVNNDLFLFNVTDVSRVSIKCVGL